MNAVIYSRINQSSLSNGHQTSELIDFSKSKGLVIVKHFEEVSTGVNTIEERHILNDLIEYIKENKINNVVIQSKDRLSRDAHLLSQITNIFDSIHVVLHVQSE
jgi:DNA invertase Pin-like site-specific DNA recombinase